MMSQGKTHTGGYGLSPLYGSLFAVAEGGLRAGRMPGRETMATTSLDGGCRATFSK